MTNRNPHARHLLRALAVATLVVVVSGAGGADASPTGNPSLNELEAQRSKVRSDKASTASEIDTLNASEAEITAALADLRANVATQSSRVEESQREVAQAEADEEAALDAEAQAKEELAAIEGDLKTQAIAAYVSSPADETMEMLSANDISDALNKRTVLQMQASRNLDSVEQYRTIQEDLAAARTAAEDASARAAEKRTEVETRLAELESAQSQQEEFAASVEDSIDAALSEAASLATLDTELSTQISSEQTRLAKELAAQQEAARQRAAAAGSRRSTSSSSGSSGSGSSGGSAPSLPSSGGNGIVSVRGIRVDSSIAGSLESMLAAAEADGISMSGGGYRDPAGQIAVRKNNCGTSNYAIYEMPSSSCSPPTAKPGRSMHEQGLAIDFTQNGRTLTRSSSAFAWLKANAGSYGFKNLPSEAWHWSTNGN